MNTYTMDNTECTPDEFTNADVANDLFQMHTFGHKTVRSIEKLFRYVIVAVSESPFFSFAHYSLTHQGSKRVFT